LLVKVIVKVEQKIEKLQLPGTLDFNNHGCAVSVESGYVDGGPRPGVAFDHDVTVDERRFGSPHPGYSTRCCV